MERHASDRKIKGVSPDQGVRFVDLSPKGRHGSLFLVSNPVCGYQIKVLI